MGRSSPTQKKAKRQRQKVRRKLVFAANLASQETACSNTSCREPNEASCREPNEPESSEIDCVDLCMGDVDTDIVEMEVYDDYRQIDGEPYPPTYLLKCRKKLMTKVLKYRKQVHELEREVAHVKSKSNEEKERLRKYYETIAFAKSRSGRMVRSAMGTANAAGKIIREMEALYSVENDSNYY